MPLPYRPTVFFALLSQENKEAVLKEVAEAAAARFKQYREALRDGVGLTELTAVERLEAYRIRQSEIWSRLQASFPI